MATIYTMENIQCKLVGYRKQTTERNGNVLLGCLCEMQLFSIATMKKTVVF